MNQRAKSLDMRGPLNLNVRMLEGPTGLVSLLCAGLRPDTLFRLRYVLGSSLADMIQFGGC
jgi:hypothetical protein